MTYEPGRKGKNENRQGQGPTTLSKDMPPKTKRTLTKSRLSKILAPPNGGMALESKPLILVFGRLTAHRVLRAVLSDG